MDSGSIIDQIERAAPVDRDAALQEVGHSHVDGGDTAITSTTASRSEHAAGYDRHRQPERV